MSFYVVLFLVPWPVCAMASVTCWRHGWCHPESSAIQDEPAYKCTRKNVYKNVTDQTLKVSLSPFLLDPPSVESLRFFGKLRCTTRPGTMQLMYQELIEINETMLNASFRGGYGSCAYLLVAFCKHIRSGSWSLTNWTTNSWEVSEKCQRSVVWEFSLALYQALLSYHLVSI